MRILAIIMAVGAIGFGLFTIIFGIVNPDQEPHAFHNAIVASLLIVVAAPPVLSIAREPDRASGPLLVLAAIGVAAVATMALSLTIDPFTLPFVVLSGVLWALAGDRPGRASIGTLSWALLALTALAAVALAPYAWEQATLQRADDSSEHDAFYHWVEMSFYAAAIPLTGVVAAFRSGSWRLAGWMAGGALLVLGGASIAFAGYASALPTVLGWLCVGGGAAFLVVTEMEARR